MVAREHGSTPRHWPTSQFRFCSFIFVDYVLILHDYQMTFSPICSVVYALGLVRLISRCYAVPQCSMHPNRCLLVPGMPIPFGFPFVFACITIHDFLLVIALSMLRHGAHTVQLPPHSVFIMLSSFLPH